MLRRTGRAVVGATSVGAAAVGAIAAVPSAYLALLTVVGARRDAPERGATDEVPTFAVLVPAHDEERSIGALLASCCALDYPGDRFSVHVVADNCTDATADVVRAAGWHAHVRDAPDDPGKGPALNWLFDRLVADGVPFDAAIVVDADTVVGPSALRAFAGALAGGAAVAQGYYAVRDPEASAATSFRYAALACRHFLRASARTRLGASCGLYGNGMMFRRDVLASRRWSGHLVEDAELQNELLLDGTRVVFVAGAVVEAEMPTSTEQSVSQHQRWERGRVEVAQRYVPAHLRRLAAGSRPVAHADAVLDHVTPPLSVLAGLDLLAIGLAVPGVVAGRRSARRGFVAGAAGVAVLALHVIAGLRVVGASREHARALLGAPRIVAWKIGLWAGVLGNDEVAWTRTQRNAEATTPEPDEVVA